MKKCIKEIMIHFIKFCWIELYFPYSPLQIIEGISNTDFLYDRYFRIGNTKSVEWLDLFRPWYKLDKNRIKIRL